MNAGSGEVWVAGEGLKINLLLPWKSHTTPYWARMARKTRRKDAIRGSVDIPWVKDYVSLFITCMRHR